MNVTDDKGAAIFNRVAERIREKVTADGEYRVGTAVLCEIIGDDERDAARTAQRLAAAVGVWWRFENERGTIWFGRDEALGPARGESGIGGQQ